MKRADPDGGGAKGATRDPARFGAADRAR